MTGSKAQEKKKAGATWRKKQAPKRKFTLKGQ